MEKKKSFGNLIINICDVKLEDLKYAPFSILMMKEYFCTGYQYVYIQHILEIIINCLSIRRIPAFYAYSDFA